MEYVMKKNGNRNSVSIKTVSEALDVPAEVIKWNLEKFGTLENINNPDDYYPNGKTYYLYPQAILWCMKKTDSAEFTAVSDLLAAMATHDADLTKKEDEEYAQRAVEALKDAISNLAEVREALNLAEETVEKTTMGIMNTAGIKKSAKNDKQSDRWNSFIKNDPGLPTLTKEEKDWAFSMDRLIRQKVEETGVAKVRIYKLAYEVMNRNYGIVFDQERKEYLNKVDLPANTAMTTFRLVTYNPQLRSLMQSIVGNIEEYTEKVKTA